MPIDGGLVATILTRAGVTGTIQAGMRTAGTVRETRGPYGYTGPGNHAEANLFRGCQDFVQGAIDRQGGVIATMHVVCSHSPCDGCRAEIIGFKAYFLAAFTSWEFAWSTHWFPPNVRENLDAANTLVATRNTTRAASVALVATRLGELQSAQTTHGQLTRALVGKNDGARALINAAIGRQVLVIQARTAAWTAAGLQRGIDEASYQQAVAACVAPQLAYTTHLQAQIANLAALQAAGWNVTQV
jgi:hypothetical protein